MRWVKLAFGVILALLIVGSPVSAFADDGPTAQEIEQGQRFQPTAEEMRAAGDPAIVVWRDIGNFFAPFGQTIWSNSGSGGRENTVEVLASAAGIAIGLVFVWWGVRKVSKVLFAAFRKGRASI